MNTKNIRNHKSLYLVFLCFLLVLIAMVSFTLGHFPITLQEVFQVLFSSSSSYDMDPRIPLVLLQIRLPRILFVIVVGAGLSVAGSCLQALFQNPMVSPDLLGASAGSAFGAAIALLFGFSYVLILTTSFVFGLFTVVVVLLLHRLVRSSGNVSLILIGMMIGTVFSSGITYIKLIGDPHNTLPAITYWLMGSFASVRMSQAIIILPIIVVATLPILLFRWKLNVISLGDEEARSLGVDVRFMRLLLILCATIITAACVAVTGLIGWVGLIVPHMARLLFGADHRYSLFASALIGACFLLIIDNFARLLSTTEIPIGILTSLIGAPLFLYLLIKKRNSTWEKV